MLAVVSAYLKHNQKNIILQIPFSVISAQRKKGINMQKNWNVH